MVEMLWLLLLREKAADRQDRKEDSEREIYPKWSHQETPVHLTILTDHVSNLILVFFRDSVDSQLAPRQFFGLKNRNRFVHCRSHVNGCSHYFVIMDVHGRNYWGMVCEREVYSMKRLNREIPVEQKDRKSRDPE